MKVSAPILNARNEAIGSLLLTIPQIRVDEHGPLHELGRLVRRVADGTSLRLGGTPQDSKREFSESGSGG